MSGTLKRILCKISTGHFYRVVKWHYTHGPTGNDPAFIEGIQECLNCGKRKHFTVGRGSKAEVYIERYLKDREW